jgi:hypothetical protein
VKRADAHPDKATGGRIDRPPAHPNNNEKRHASHAPMALSRQTEPENEMAPAKYFKILTSYQSKYYCLTNNARGLFSASTFFSTSFSKVAKISKESAIF